MTRWPGGRASESEWRGLGSILIFVIEQAIYKFIRITYSSYAYPYIENWDGFVMLYFQPMEEIKHNGENFKYVLVIKKDGKTTRTEILDWRVGQKEIETDQIYSPYEIYVEAHNMEGTFEEPAVVHIGYSGEGSEFIVKVFQYWHGIKKTCPCDIQIFPKL